MTKPRRSHLAGALALTASLALTGCATTTAAAPKPATTLSKASFAPALVTAETKAGTVHERITTTVAKQSVTIDADVTGIGPDPSKLAMHETIAISGQPTIDMVYVAKAFYINAGAATGNRYVKLDAAKPGSLGKVSANVTDSQAEADPATTTAQLKKAVLFVQRAGATTGVGSATTTPYLVGLNASALSGILGPLIGSTTALPAEVDIDFWIDADGLPRRSSLVVDNIDEETYYTDWGAHLTIKVPSAGSSQTDTAAAGRDSAGPPD